MKSQILAVEPILEGRDARPLTIWGKFICVLILSLIGLVASTPLSGAVRFGADQRDHS